MANKEDCLDLDERAKALIELGFNSEDSLDPFEDLILSDEENGRGEDEIETCSR